MEVVSVIDPITDKTMHFDKLPVALQLAMKELLGDGLVVFRSHRSPHEASTQADLIIAKRNPEALWISGYEDRILYDYRRPEHEKYAGLVSFLLASFQNGYIEEEKTMELIKEVA